MKRLLVHADDLGVFQSSLDAAVELFAAGIVRSGSAIVTGPWFSAVAAWAAAHPEADLGVHLALTSEWDAYRWRPVTGAPSLADAHGYFHHRRDDVLAADPPLQDIRDEVRRQIALARAAGLRPTHLDAHMFVLRNPRYLDLFLDLALEERLPALVTRAEASREGWPFPRFDSIHSLTLNDEASRVEAVMAFVNALGEGLHALLIHPAKDSPELRAAASDWRCRVSDYKVFRDPALRTRIEHAGVELVGWR